MPSLLGTIDDTASPIYYSDTFRQVVEDHLTYLKNMSTVSTYLLTDDDWATLNKYVGDFYGFLTEMNYKPQYQWTIMRMNGYRSRFDLDLTLSSLLLPDWDFVDKLAQVAKEKRST